VGAVDTPAEVRPVPFRDVLRFWVKLGFINFGGPTGQIAIMHHELVERRRWIDEEHYLHALNFAMLLPGPEAHQLAIYVGWLLNGAPGALAAGVFFLLPAFVLIVALSWVYVTHGDVPWVAAVLAGLSWAVVGIVAGAVVRIAGRAIRNRVEIAVAIAAFLALYLFAVPFPLVVLGAGAIGLVAGSRFPSVLPDDGASEPAQVQEPARVEPSWRRAVRVLAVGLTVWLGPLALVVVAAGTESVLAQEAVFFSVMALVTFGGAYAVLAYVNQAAVTRFGWLTSDEMAVGLSLAETTPGPLILTVVFVGFVAAYRSPGSLEPVAAGIAGALVTAWATFVPSFVWIFLGAPSVERLRGNRRLSSGLAAITASVVGVIANLGLVFAVSVLFEETTTVPFLGHDLMVPVAGSLDPLALAVAAASFVAVWRLRANVVWIVLGAGVVGWARLVLG
jgi:chromate transporter